MYLDDRKIKMENICILRPRRFTQEEYLVEAEKILTRKVNLMQNARSSRDNSSLEDKIYVRPEEFGVFIGAGVKDIGTRSYWTEHHGKVYEYELNYQGQTLTTRTFLPYIFTV